LDRWTSTNGIATAASASRNAMLVWVNAPALMMMKWCRRPALRGSVDQAALVVALETSAP